MHTNPEASASSLEHVSNDDLHARTRRLVGRANQVLAALLAHLAEVEARGIHRTRACASLYTYCIYELRMSEDAAFRRARAAAIARQFPVLFEQIAAGEIHLTAVLMLGPHLTEQNHLEVLALAKHRTKREIAQLVRTLNPLPDVPAVVEPLGPVSADGTGSTGIPVPRNPTWKQFVTSRSGPVRELSPGDRPKDWIDNDAGDAVVEPEEESLEATPCTGGDTDDAAQLAPSALAPQRYKVQFTATQEYVDLLEEARDLLSHAVSGRSLEQVHLRAMRSLVTQLRKRRYAATTKHSTASPERRHGH